MHRPATGTSLPGFGGPILRYGSVLWARISTFGFRSRAGCSRPRLNILRLDHESRIPAGQSQPVQRMDSAVLTWQRRRGTVGDGMEMVAAHTRATPITEITLEAANLRTWPAQRVAVADWTVPVTSRLLIQATASLNKQERRVVPRAGLRPDMIGVVEQSTGLAYRAGGTYASRPQQSIGLRSVASYILGAHAFKAGITHRGGELRERTFDLNPLSFRFDNGVPNRLTQRALPIETGFNIHHEMGVFAQHIGPSHAYADLWGGRFSGGFPSSGRSLCLRQHGPHVS